MSTKKEVLTQVLEGKGPLGKSQDDEPVFVLVGRDIYAPQIIRAWCNLLGSGAGPLPTTHEEAAEYASKVNPKYRDAMEIANQMSDWQVKHGSKTPD